MSQGLITSGLNHAAHELTQIIGRNGKLLLDIDDGSNAVFAIDDFADFVRELSCMDYCNSELVAQLSDKYSVENSYLLSVYKNDFGEVGMRFKTGFDRGYEPTFKNVGSEAFLFDKGGGTYSYGQRIGKSFKSRGWLNPYNLTRSSAKPVFSNSIYKNYNPFNIYRY